MERARVNPVIPGFAPDPSLIYVDGTYFLVNSSFHMFPGLPVYASKDLNKWIQIGNAINRTGQLSLQNSLTKLCEPEDGVQMAAQGGLFAPTIRYHKGTFYIVCTNVFHRRYLPLAEDEHQNFIVSTTDIWADEWSDPVCFDFFGIDTSLFWDDNRAYLIGASGPPPATRIRQFEIDVKTGKKLSEEKLLWAGLTDFFAEGPHMYKRDGWYYLLIAEGGCFEGHHVNMARSRDIWGPYEPNPANPVLDKADPHGYVQYTGHGDLFQDPSGQWYFVCLGVRKNNGRFVMGRESVLTTATWPEGEFAVIDTCTAQIDVPIVAGRNSNPEWPDRRKPGRPDVSFLGIRDPIVENYEYEGNGVVLTSSKMELSQAREPVTFIGKRQRRLEGSDWATLEVPPLSATNGASLKTGICYYKDEHRFIRAFLDVDSGEIVLETVNKARSIERKTSRGVGGLVNGTKIRFGIDHTELELMFWYSVLADGAETRERLGEIDTLDMSGHDFVGPVIGVFAVSDNQVKVRYLEIYVEGI